MCELLGMSARRATDVNHSLALLRPRGGEIGPHADGWGIAFYEGRAARVFKEPIPASESRCLAFIAEYDYRSTVVVGHIRKANPSRFGRASANTHPFHRELGGRSWVFAHNGKLPGIEHPRFDPRRFQPIGETDSERAFCFLLDRVAERWSGGPPLAPQVLVDILAAPVEELAALGEFNMLMSDGASLVAFANTRLHTVTRRCVEEGCAQEVLVLATSPLTDEAWQPMPAGAVQVFVEGRLATNSSYPASTPTSPNAPSG